MKREILSSEENIAMLRIELSELYQDTRFLKSTRMGELLADSIAMLEVQPVRKRNKVKIS